MPEDNKKTASAGDTKLEGVSATADVQQQGQAFATNERGSIITQDYGERKMKSYPITDGELNELYKFGLLITIFFSIALGLIGFAINIYKDLSFSPELAPEITGTWNTIAIGSIILGVFSLIVGGILVWLGHGKIAELKKDTNFPNR